jgi:hypothetical protein
MTAQSPVLKALELSIDWDRGAPCPILVQDGSQSVVCFYASRAPSAVPTWDATLVDPSQAVGVVGVVAFSGCYASTVSGYGWAESQEHPLWTLGLRRFRRHAAFEIVSSHWVTEYRGFRGDRSLRHFALLFPDSTMEFLAEEFAVHTESGSVVEIAERQVRHSRNAGA